MTPIYLPYSKSLQLRILAMEWVAAAVGGSGFCCDVPPGASADVEHFCRALHQLDHSRNSGINEDIYIGDGAAPMRILLALAAATPGVKATVIPSPQLARRPHAEIVDSLRQSGADISVVEIADIPAFRIAGNRLKGGEVETDVALSSQYATALMLASPLMERGCRVKFRGSPVSVPYLSMTAEVMRCFGADVILGSDGALINHALPSCRRECKPERDWSAASYFYEVALLHPGLQIYLPGLLPTGKSLQGDSVCSEIFAAVGVASRYVDGGIMIKNASDKICIAEPVALDCSDFPDLVPALAVAFALKGIPFTFRGISNLRFKECDRGEALREELAKLGIILTVTPDIISFDGRRYPVAASHIVLNSHNDHRMAMALDPHIIALSGFPPITMKGGEAVSKSFPAFHQVIELMSM